MATEGLYIKCQNEDCGRMGLFKTFHIYSDGSREEMARYDDCKEQWLSSGGGFRCPYCGTEATLARV